MDPRSPRLELETLKTSTPHLLWTISRTLLGTGALGVAIVAALNDGSAFQWEPVPDSWPIRALFEWASAAALLLAGVLLCLKRRVAFGGALVAFVTACWIIVLHVPRIFAGVEAAWLGAAECLAMASGALLTATQHRRWTEAARRRVARAVSVAFGLSLISFGVAHFIYAKITADMVPSWLPGRLYWAYFTGVAHLAAGISMLSGILQRWSSLLLGCMFGIFALSVNLPSALSQSFPAESATGFGVATILTGAAFAIAGEVWARGSR